MDESTREVMYECAEGSIAGQLPFPEIVRKLAAVGCEQYHADLRRREKTFYMPDGESHSEPLPASDKAIAQTFSEAGIATAIRLSQERQLAYPEFLERIMAAGCVGYFVYIAGMRALYLGRRGEIHVEPFPGDVAARTEQVA